MNMDRKAGAFPTHADEEQMVYGVPMGKFIILAGSLGLLLITRMVILSFAIGFVLYYSYSAYKEAGQKNIIWQIAYKIGLYVPKSHIFAEPSEDSFRG